MTFRKMTLFAVLSMIAVLMALSVSVYAYRSSAVSKAPKETPQKQVESLWKEYEAMGKKDRPKDQQDVLDKIKTISKDNRLSWDFYRACKEYYLNVSRVNWKERESAKEILDKEVENYNLPIMTIYHKLESPAGRGWNRQEIFDFIKEHESDLKKSDEKGFVTTTGRGKLSMLIIKGDFFSNDYQNALWMAFSSYNYDKEIAEPLLKDLNGKYPQAAYIEYCILQNKYYSEDTTLRDKEYNDFIQKYSDKAISVLAKEDVLDFKKASLDKNNGTSSQYKALADECEAFFDMKMKYSGSEAVIASYSNSEFYLLAELRRKEASMEVKDGVISISVKNLSSVNISLKDKDGKKSLWKTTVDNPKKSFYVRDTVSVNIPDIDDGEYLITCNASGISEKKYAYQKYSISIATKVSDKGWEIYAADSKTGKPFGSVSGIELDGFTVLPKEMVDKLKSSSKESIKFETQSPTGKKLLSKEVKAYNFNDYYKGKETTNTFGRILTDCASFHPGDTVKFKVIAYSQTTGSGKKAIMKTLPKGESLKVVLKDPEWKDVSELTLTTNEFGSASGEFEIPKDRKNGGFQIVLSTQKQNRNLGSTSITVGDYVLPTFEVVINPLNKDVFPGETLTFTGKVVSYSAKAVSRDNASYRLTKNNDVVSEGKLDINPDGTFTITAPDAEEGNYLVEVSVTDSTGETKSAQRYKNVSESVIAYLRFEKTATGKYFKSYEGRYATNGYLINSDTLEVSFLHDNSDNAQSDATFEYTITQEGKAVLSGTAQANKTTSIILPSSESGLYQIQYHAEVTASTGKVFKSSENKQEFLKVKPTATSIDAPIKYFILNGENEVIIGSADGDIYPIASIYSSEGKLLRETQYHIKGDRAKPGSIEHIGVDYDPSYSGDVSMQIFFFRNYRNHSWDKTFKSKKQDEKLPLEFSSFTDKTSPSAVTSISLKTYPMAELAATVYDKTTESIQSLYWNEVRLPDIYMVKPILRYLNGSNSADNDEMILDDYLVVGYGVAPKRRMAKSAVTLNAVASDEMSMDMALADNMVEEVAAPFMIVSESASESDAEASMIYSENENIEPSSVRDVLLDVLAFEPHLRPDTNGDVSFSFSPSGKLSTYIVKVYAHDKDMRTASSSREIVVTQPIQVSVVQPQFLYEGDKYILHAGVSSDIEALIKEGTMTLSVYDGTDRTTKAITKISKKVSLSSEDGSASASFEIPSIPECKSGTIGLMVSFSANDKDGNKVSDAMMVSTPVFKAQKMMTEAHSAIYRSGQDKAMVIDLLKSQFTNLNAKKATLSEKTIADMIADVLNESKDPGCDDAMSLMQALQVRLLSAKLSGKETDVTELVSKIKECRDASGGYSWRKGMDPSQSVTSYILSGIAMLRDKGILPDGLSDYESAVKYLDNERTSQKYYWYFCGLSEYCFVRSAFPEVKFEAKTTQEFRKEIREYLNPGDEKDYQGNIMGKVRRSLTIDNLSKSEDGIALAKAWGIKLATSAKIASTRKMDMESVRQYAQKHTNGGMYFPNAVLPFRGLLESELYAHTLICKLFKDSDAALSDDVRLWMLLQKETQEWKSDPTTVLAVAEIMEGTEAMLQTTVISLTASEMQKFKDTNATANGFTIKSTYYVIGNDGSLTKLSKGEKVKVGQKVRAAYEVFSQENRSFVVMETPRPACLIPERQISGRYGWRLYRDVRLNKTQWYWDVFPEEKTTIYEDFVVSQEGEFQYPASEIICTYAPHWMANDNAPSNMKVIF